MATVSVPSTVIAASRAPRRRCSCVASPSRARNMARAPGHLHARLSTTRDSRSPPARQGNRANEERHFQGRAGIGVLRPGGHVTHCLTQRPVAQRLRSPARSASARRSASASAWTIVSKCSSRRPGILPVLTGPADACVPVFMGVDNLRVPRVSGAVFRHTKTAPDTGSLEGYCSQESGLRIGYSLRTPLSLGRTPNPAWSRPRIVMAPRVSAPGYQRPTPWR